MIKNIYIHIPFCRKKCTFCDFSIYAVGSKFNNQDLYEKYITNLKNEIKFIFGNYLNYFGNINSLYFGGGTPSLIHPKFIESVIQEISKYCKFSYDAEISLESDPNTFDKETLKFYSDIGVNRITMGIQSLDENVLKNLNRSHSKTEALKSIELLKSSEINFGLDLIQGLPNQDIFSFENDLKFLSSLDVQHLSIYMLSLEKNSSLYKKYNKEYNSQIKQDLLTDMFIMSHQYLSSEGYEHYEISNFCKNNKISKHNKSYWDGLSEFYGFGSSASSYFNGKRFAKPSSISKYYQFINNIDKTFEDFINDNDSLDEDSTEVRNLKYYLLNQIRRKEGINMTILKKNFNNDYYNKINNFFQNRNLGLSEAYSNEDEFIRLKYPFGILVSDEILVDLFIFIFD